MNESEGQVLNPCHQMARASSVPASGLFSQRQLSPFTQSWTAKLLGHCSGLLESGALSMVNSCSRGKGRSTVVGFQK